MITSILYFLLALGILVFVHELGHFLVAKWSGIRVERFSLGYPPKMIGFQYGETEYCLSWIPFGGYVKVAGMADVGSEESSGEPWEFPSKPIWIRMAVIVAGPVMNFIFAFFAFFTIYSVFGIDTVVSTIVEPVQSSVSELAGIRRGDVIRSVDGQAVANELQLRSAIEGTESRGVTVEVNRDGASYNFELGASKEDFYGLQVLIPTTVGTVSDDMPAATIGLIQGDRITSVDGVAVHSWSDMKREISAHPDIQVALRWRRAETLMESPITPIARADGDSVIGLIGITPYTARTPIGLSRAVSLGADNVVASSMLILDFLGQLFSGDRYKELGGPIRIAKLAGETAERGMDNFLYFLGLLSVNLAILNLLPIPVLDGGHLFFMILETLMRRPLSLRKREFFQQVGMVIILGIMVLVTFNDLNQLVFHHIVDFFQ
jgi:regulator of sigma E protease